MPSSVSISIRMEWGIRPSMMWVRLTPRRTASTQQSIFGNHPAGDDSLVFQMGDLADLHHRDERAVVLLVPQQAAHVGHQHQLFRAKGGGDAGGGDVGVDVVGFAVVFPGRAMVATTGMVSLSRL